MISNVNPSKITEARDSRAVSMEELATYVGVTRQSISKYERGIAKPSTEVLQSISYYLDFPVSFFHSTDSSVPANNITLFFRSNSNISKKVKSACKYQIEWIDEIKAKLETYVDFVDQNVPVVDKDYEDISLEEIENLALSIRQQWGLGDAPINDLIGVLENNGVIVSPLSINRLCEFKGIDAFSSWIIGTPYIAYNPAKKSAVRTRFSILHELGHLVLHSSIPNEDAIKKDIIDKADMQADRFAAAFLLPATSFVKDVYGTSLSSLEVIKQKWGVSMSAIIKRYETLDLMTENQLNYLKRQMTAKKYWYKEPLDDQITLAPPEIIRDAIMMLVDNNIVSKELFLHLVKLSADDVINMCCLPSDYFDSCNRRKPMLRVISSH